VVARAAATAAHMELRRGCAALAGQSKEERDLRGVREKELWGGRLMEVRERDSCSQ
jgi:hypothetical protein